MWFWLFFIFSDTFRIIFFITLGIGLIIGLVVLLKNNKNSKLFLNDIKLTKEIIKNKVFDITEKMTKLTDHLEIINNLKTVNKKEIYQKNKSLLIILYEYYCKYQKLYLDLSFSQILNPVSIETIKNMDIKYFTNNLKLYQKNDFEITIENLNEEDKQIIKNIHNKYEFETDELINTIINIQSNIIANELSPIEESTMIENIDKTINPISINENFNNLNNNYRNIINEYNATKEIIK